MAGRIIRPLAALGFGLAASCAPLPGVAPDRAQATAPRDYPRLLPIGEVLVRAEPSRTHEAGRDAELRDRAARLRARAARLGGPVMDEATRQRLEASLAD